MANKDLKGHTFIIPDDIINHLKTILNSFNGNENAKGLSRLTNLIENPEMTYEQIKRIKNFFDHADIEEDFQEYRLNGGDIMKKWVNDSLDDERFMIHRQKELRANSGEKNQFKKSFTKGSKTMDRDYLLDKIRVNENIDRIKKIMFR